MFQRYKHKDCKKGPFRLLLRLPLYDFCMDMPEDALSTCRNTWHTCKVNQLN